MLEVRRETMLHKNWFFDEEMARISFARVSLNNLDEEDDLDDEEKT